MNCSLDKRRWTVEETAILREMQADRHPFSNIAARLERSLKSVKERWRTINRSETELRNRADRAFRSYKPKTEAKRYRKPQPLTAPEQVLIDREVRMAAPRTLTSALFGDPAPGWSALDRRA